MDSQSAYQVASPEPQISMCRVHVSMDFAAGFRCAAWQCWETARALTAERRANSWNPFLLSRIEAVARWQNVLVVLPTCLCSGGFLKDVGSALHLAELQALTRSAVPALPTPTAQLQLEPSGCVAFRSCSGAFVQPRVFCQPGLKSHSTIHAVPT